MTSEAIVEALEKATHDEDITKVERDKQALQAEIHHKMAIFFFTKFPRNKLLTALLILLAIAAAGLMLYSTPLGVGLGFDSVAYISAGRNLVNGIGLGRFTCLGFKPMTLWPPLYPFILAFFSFFGLDALVAARIVSAVGFGLSVFLAGFTVSRITRSLVFPLMGASLIILYSPILRTFSWAMSEALYIPLALAAFIILGKYLVHSRQNYPIYSALLVGSTILTRYIGVSILAIGILVLILDNKYSFGRRIKNIFLFSAIASCPLLGWMVRNEFVASSTTSRKFGFTFIQMIDLDPFIKQITSWILPVSYTIHRMRLLLIGMCFIGFVVLTIYIIIMKRKKFSEEFNLLILFLLHNLIYPLVVIATMVFIIPSISTVDERIMIPLLISSLILFAFILVYAWNTQKWFLRIICLLIFIWMIVYNLPQQIETIKTLHSDGQGYAARIWQESAAIVYLKRMPTDMIYTNDFQALYFMADKNACILPNNEETLVQMQENIHRENGSVVIIGDHLPEFLPIEDMVEGMSLVKEFPDVRIFQYISNEP